MKTKTIKQTVTFSATPEKVYDLLMESKQHSAFTGTKVTISKKPDGKFKVFDGYCSGHNIELKKGKKIVQAWHFAEEGWPEDHYSICKFEFKKVPSGTKLTFTQTGVPAQNAKALTSGWKEYYWQPMKKHLKS